jgi:hypothetical protein
VGCCTGFGTSTGPPARSSALAGGCIGSPPEAGSQTPSNRHRSVADDRRALRGGQAPTTLIFDEDVGVAAPRMARPSWDLGGASWRIIRSGGDSEVE